MFDMLLRHVSVVTLTAILGGGLIGAMSCDWTVREAGCLEPTVYGAILGSSILMSVGVHLIS